MYIEDMKSFRCFYEKIMHAGNISNQNQQENNFDKMNDNETNILICQETKIAKNKGQISNEISPL